MGECSASSIAQEPVVIVCRMVAGTQRRPTYYAGFALSVAFDRDVEQREHRNHQQISDRRKRRVLEAK